MSFPVSYSGVAAKCSPPARLAYGQARERWGSSMSLSRSGAPFATPVGFDMAAVDLRLESVELSLHFHSWKRDNEWLA